jgi:hypothetical protein
MIKEINRKTHKRILLGKLTRSIFQRYQTFGSCRVHFKDNCVDCEALYPPKVFMDGRPEGISYMNCNLIESTKIFLEIIRENINNSDLSNLLLLYSEMKYFAVIEGVFCDHQQVELKFNEEESKILEVKLMDDIKEKLGNVRENLNIPEIREKLCIWEEKIVLFIEMMNEDIGYQKYMDSETFSLIHDIINCESIKQPPLYNGEIICSDESDIEVEYVVFKVYRKDNIFRYAKTNGNVFDSLVQDFKA